jgi:hypothetical protein
MSSLSVKKFATEDLQNRYSNRAGRAVDDRTAYLVLDQERVRAIDRFTPKVGGRDMGFDRCFTLSL